MHELTCPEELVLACADDTLTVWAAQGLAERPGGRSRAWAGGGAVVVAAPDLSVRDRMTVHAPAASTGPGAAVDLVRAVLAEVGPSFRPLVDAALVDPLVAGIPGLGVRGAFSWMDRSADAPAPARVRTPAPARETAGDGAAAWLPDDGATRAEIHALLDLAFPDSYARPGDPAVERWAGVRDPADGTLRAVAALAWSAPEVSLLAGVTVHPDARGRGLAARVCGLAVDGALAARGRVGLMVDDWNTPAVRLYERLGLRRRPVAVAAY